MKQLLFLPVLLAVFCIPCSAWDGFDADTMELVEIMPEVVPLPGQTVDVRSYDTDSTENCIVESVIRNRRTIEVTVRYPDGKKHILVMESQ